MADSCSLYFISDVLAADCLDQAELWDIAQSLEMVTPEKDEIIIREGDPGKHIFFLELGRCRVTSHVEGDNREFELGDIEPGGYFGEIAALSGEGRRATVRATEDSKLYRITPDLLPQKTVDRLWKRTSTYMRYRCSLALLNSMQFCKGLSDSDLWKIGKACQLVSYSKDQYIVREGAEGVNLFIITKGMYR